MSVEVGKAYVQIIPSARGISGSIQKAISGEASAAGASAGDSIVGKIKSAIVAAGIGTTIASGIKTAVSQGAELEQNLGGTEAVFGQFARNVQATAKDSYTNMGLSASEYMATANKMGSLFQGSGIEQQRSLDLTTASMQRAADVASVMGIDTSWAMESIAGAAKGNFTMMDNLGVAMNATTLQAYALEKGINFKWNTASNAEKAELAMQMFMERTSQYEGNFARESEQTLSGSLGAMKAAAQDFAGNLALGENVAPSFENLLATVGNFGSNLLPMLSNIISGVAQSFGTLITTYAPQWLQSGLAIMQQVGQGLATGIPAFLAQAAPMLSQFVSNLRAGAGEFISGGVELITNVGQGLANGIPAVAAQMPSIIGNIAGFIIENGAKLIEGGAQLMADFANGFAAGAGAFFANLSPMIENIKSAFANVDWKGLGTACLNLIEASFNLAKSVLPPLLKAAGQAAVNAFKAVDWKGVGKAAIDFIKTAASAAGNLIVTALKTIGTQAINAFKAVDWKGVGKAAIDFIKTAASGAGNLIVTALKTIGTNALNAFKNINWKGVGKSVIEFIKTAASGAGSLVVNALKTVGNNALNAFKNIDWKELGSNIINGIIEGVSNAASSLIDTLKGLASKALKAAKKKLKISSPSKVFAEEVGRWIPAGIGEGITDNAGYMQKALTDATDDLAAAPFAGSAGAGTGGTAVSYGGVNINVYAAEGQSARDIAEEVSRILEQRVHSKRAVYA